MSSWLLRSGLFILIFPPRSLSLSRYLSKLGDRLLSKCYLLLSLDLDRLRSCFPRRLLLSLSLLISILMLECNSYLCNKIDITKIKQQTIQSKTIVDYIYSYLNHCESCLRKLRRSSHSYYWMHLSFACSGLCLEVFSCLGFFCIDDNGPHSIYSSFILIIVILIGAFASILFAFSFCCFDFCSYPSCLYGFSRFFITCIYSMENFYCL